MQHHTSGVILVINAGSSSLKFAAYASEPPQPRRLWRGQLDGIDSEPHFVVRDAADGPLAERRWPTGEWLSHAQAFDAIRDWLDTRPGPTRLLAVGHRVVHGGGRFTAPVRVDLDVLHQLERLIALAPLHQPHSLAIIRALLASEPQLPQVACFDTAFHATLPEVAQRFALPRALHQAGLRRYGFHGLSYEFIARCLRQLDPAAACGRVVVAHLGAGASLAALHDGRCIETTMSFTPLDGLPMATRSGAIDPGALLHLLEQRKMSVAELGRLLYFESGLLGVSGLSGDMRMLLESGSSAAREAVELFVYRTVREIGAMVAVLGGLDTLVFTAGIGENAVEIRRRICQPLRWLGLTLDAAANAANAAHVSTDGSAVKVLVQPTDEEQMIAIHTAQALGSVYR